ncbi:MAG: hypothetical protein JSR93_10445 [Verrucomicrobia bacterium]|nr:hypothetical protein [Verrucomicrobiota bacterium]
MVWLFLPSLVIATAPSEQKQEEHWSANIQFLYWKASEPGLDYAVQVSSNAQFQPKAMHWNRPSFEWAPGFRLGFSDLQIKKPWSLALIWTHYNSESKGHSSGGSEHRFLEQLWVPSPFGVDALRASGNWKLHYNTLDCLLLHPYKMSQHSLFTPGFGLRGLFINQHFTAKYAGGDFSSQKPIRLKAENDYNALGIHLDLGLQFDWNKHWGLFAKGTGTLLYGQFDVPEKVSGENVLIQVSSKHLFKEHRSFWEVTNDLGAAIGIHYKTVQKKCTVDLSFAYEIIKTFNQNQLRRYRDQNPENPQNTDLGLEGITLALDIKW